MKPLRKKQLLVTGLSVLSFFVHAQSVSTDWNTSGNSNVSQNDFLGTIDSTALRLQTNSETRLFVGADGKLGVGTQSPQSRLDIANGDLRLGVLAGNGVRILAVDSTGKVFAPGISLRGGGGIACSPVLDGWGTEVPTPTILRLCGTYTSISLGSQPIINNGNLPNLVLEARGDARFGGDTEFQRLAGGTGLNVVFSDPNGKLTLAPTVGTDPFWGTSGTQAQPGMFLGTTNNQDLVIRANNIPRLTIAKTGEIIAHGLVGAGSAPIFVNANGQLVRGSSAIYWATTGNVVAPGQSLGSTNAEALRFITNSQTRLQINPTGELSINSNPQAGIMLNINGVPNQGVALRARAFSTAQTSYPYCIVSSVNSGNVKAFAVVNEALNTGNCAQGEDVFRVWGDGRVEAKRIKVHIDNWCDYVFDDDYKLMDLEDVETFIERHGHLPEIPTTAEVKQNGDDLGEMDALLLKKIEELTLYMIEQDKHVKALEAEVKELKEQKP